MEVYFLLILMAHLTTCRRTKLFYESWNKFIEYVGSMMWIGITPVIQALTLVSTLTTASFSYSGISVNQPGTSQRLDDLASRLMYRLQYRNFGTHQSMVTNHTVNVGSGRAGVRWYELRNTGSGWSIYQQGTYAPADGDHRWMGSIAMNGNGDIGLGYSVSGSSTYPSIRVAGQTAGAPGGLGVLDIAETSILKVHLLKQE